jgi:hypothetical protein
VVEVDILQYTVDIPGIRYLLECAQIYVNIVNFGRFEVFAAVTMMNAVSWDMMPYGSCAIRRFGGTYLLSHTLMMQATSSSETSVILLHIPEDGESHGVISQKTAFFIVTSVPVSK